MKRSLLVLATSLISHSALANWVGEINYANLSDDSDGIEIDVGSIGGSLGYQYKVNDQFVITPEIRVGLGAGDDSVMGIDVELDNYYGVGLRGEYFVTDDFYVMASAAYLEVELSASGFGQSVSASEGEFGLGLGAGFMVSDAGSLEIGYESFDDVDVLRAGFRYRF